jgi:hypothetical protein
MDEDLRVGQRHALSLRPAGEKQRAHAHRDPDADRLHVGLDELHRVVDGEPVVDGAARRVDVDRDVLVGVLGLEVEQLGDSEVRDLVVDRRAEEDDPLVQEPGVDVERALTERRLFDHHRDQRARSFSFLLKTVAEARGLPAGLALELRLLFGGALGGRNPFELAVADAGCLRAARTLLSPSWAWRRSS